MMKKYAIWKNKKVIGYIDLSEKQANILNSTQNIGLYFGFDAVTDPERYARHEADVNKIKKIFEERGISHE